MLPVMATSGRATKKTPSKPVRHVVTTEANRMPQLNLRLPHTIHESLGARLTKLNSGRRVKLTQSDLVRAMIEWCLDHEPDVLSE